MPDIQTALQKALAAMPRQITETLDDWSNDDTTFIPPKPATTMTTSAPAPAPTTDSSLSVSEQTFNFIRDFPYTPMADVVSALAARGLNTNSTGSLIYQMIRSGLVSRDKDGRLTALRKTYAPVQAKNPKHRRKISDRKSKAPKEADVPVKKPPVIIDVAAIKRRQLQPEGIASLSPTVTGSTATVAPALTAKQVLETLSVKEARELYLELKRMFGG